MSYQNMVWMFADSCAMSSPVGNITFFHAVLFLCLVYLYCSI